MKIQALKRAVPGCDIRFLEEEFVAVRVGVFDFEIEKIKTKYHYKVAARCSTKTSVFILERKTFDSPEAAYQEISGFLVSLQKTINEALGGSKDK
jgi:hypothetical protein